MNTSANVANGNDKLTAPRTGSEVAQARPTIPPAVDIYENNDEILVYADLPGVTPEGLNVRVHKDELHIEGKRHEDEPGRLLERGYRTHDFARGFRLPPGIDGEKIEAELTGGVLKLRLPKAEVAKPRRIEVRSS